MTLRPVGVSENQSKRIQMGEQPVSIRVIRTIRGEWAMSHHEVVTSLSRSPVSSFPISRV